MSNSGAAQLQLASRMSRSVIPALRDHAVRGSKQLRCFKQEERLTMGEAEPREREGDSLLRKIWMKQKGLCVYTGDVLVPGVNTALDHIMPRSRGGDESEENLQFIRSDVNRMKHNMTDAEFRAACRRIGGASSSCKTL